MRSPKFQYTLTEILSCINKTIVRTVWKKKVLGQLRSQILMDMVEFRDYRSRLAEMSADIIRDIERGVFNTLPTNHYLIEKSRGLCRQMTIAAPRDLLVLQCLSDRLYLQIKNSQPTKNAFFEPGKGKFSKNKVLIQRDEYGAIASWKRFQAAIFNFSKENEFIVVTDVANFYDFINLSHLRNIISSICSVSESIMDFLIFVLDELAWHPDYMPSTGVGLPQMESEAPRVLANAMLYELDKVAFDYSYGDYVRFMDDIDIGVATLAQAKRVVRDIDLTLQSRQLRLNGSKTQILRTSDGEAARHFCIRENRFLDYAARFLETGNPMAKVSVKRALERAYSVWKGGPKFERSRFLEGNGEKIFKFMAGLMTKVGSSIPSSDLLWLIRNRPSLREVCFGLLARIYDPKFELAQIHALFASGLFVDDAAYLYAAKFIVHARFSRAAGTTLRLRSMAKLFVGTNEYFKVYAGILIASKYGEPSLLVNICRSTVGHWKVDIWMARAIAGLAPMIRKSDAEFREYYLLCIKIDNPEWRSVFEYIRSLMDDAASVVDLLPYAKYPNESYPYGIYHPKVTSILAASYNKGATGQIASIKKSQPALLADDYYRPWFK